MGSYHTFFDIVNLCYALCTFIMFVVPEIPTGTPDVYTRVFDTLFAP